MKAFVYDSFSLFQILSRDLWGGLSSADETVADIKHSAPHYVRI